MFVVVVSVILMVPVVIIRFIIIFRRDCSTGRGACGAFDDRTGSASDFSAESPA